MGLFTSSKADMKEKRNEEDKNIVQKETTDLVVQCGILLNEFKSKKVILFPGNIEEYERFRNYKVEIIDPDPNNFDKRVFYESLTSLPITIQYSKENINYLIKKNFLIKNLLDNNIEALVNLGQISVGDSKYGFGQVDSHPYGLPVRKARLSKEQ